MKITKLGHCCLLIETKGKKILTDPGSFTTAQDELMGIDIILITHEHADHFHAESVKKVIEHNPTALIITNEPVGRKLAELGISHQTVQGTDTKEAAGISLEAFDARHEEIYEEIGQVQNTGYFIDGRLFYPGDAFSAFPKPVEILALPVSGPWCKLSLAIKYALMLKPKKAFLVHDGALKQPGMSHRIPATVLPENGIEFFAITEGSVQEF